MNKKVLFPALLAIAAIVLMPVVDRRPLPPPLPAIFVTPPEAGPPAAAIADSSPPPAARPQRPTTPPVSMPELPPSQDVLWETPSPLAPMAAFQKWSADFTAQPSAEKVNEGVKLAQERRAVLHSLIKHDPEQALANAVPEAVRRAMPADVQRLLESKVDARGDLLVTATTYDDGKQDGPAVTTEARLDDGREFKAFVYGNREYRPSRKDVPIHGIALDSALAVSEWPGRVMEPIERAEAKQTLGTEPVCPESGVKVSQTGTETALLIGREVEFYCGPSHARNDLATAAAAEAIRPPGLGARSRAPMDAASDGDTVPSLLSEGDPDWTRGTKRILAVRVQFEQDDGTGYDNYTDLDSEDCENIVAGIRSSLLDWSYQRYVVRPVEPGGSMVTPVIGLNRPADHYDEEDIGDIWDEVQDKTEDLGYNLDSYAIILVLAGDAPIQVVDGFGGVSWGGKGRIGEGLSFIRVNEFDHQERIDRNIGVSLHEIGHNLGLYHSSNSFTQPQFVNGVPIVGKEYGDRFCRMGSGGQDFNARYKQWLNWLDNGNVPVAISDGVYTLREHDMEEKSGLRGLQVSVEPVYLPFNSLKQLFVEYRLGPVSPLAGYPYVPYDRTLFAYGAQIRIGQPGSPKVWLLDATPETPNWEPVDPVTEEADTSGNVDSPLLPGRTFTWGRDGNSVYITNLSADPETGELEIEVQHGPIAGNDPPAGSITTSTPQGAKNQNIVFTASASDPEDSELAYHWQIPHFNYDATHPAVFPNARSITVKFPATGTFLIRCIVSDKHGGAVTLTRNYSIVVNEPPGITAIANQTIDEDEAILNLPFTVSDATTAGGSLSVTASSSNSILFPPGSIVLGTVSGGNRRISLTPPANRHGVAVITVSVSDGALTDTEEFTVTVNPVTPGTPLIASGSTWRYWDAENAPPANWNVPTFNDSTWLSDTARFIYPNHFLVHPSWTVLAAPVRPRPTCYFRKTFFMPASPTGTPTLKLLCDDGAVVYSSGVEVWRQNMPGGPVTHTTQAESSVLGGKQLTWTLVPLALSQFHLGAINTISVEVHDFGSTSRAPGDVAFDLQLHLLQAPAVSSITDKFSPEDQVAGAYSFSATEAESPPGPLTFTATSSNEALVPDSGIKVGFNIFTSSRYLMCTPQPNATGVTEITLKVSDGGSETWEKFNLTITPVNDPPYLHPVPDVAVPLNEIVPLVEVLIGDVDNNAGDLTVTVQSGNQSLLPSSGIQVLPGTAPNRRWIRLTPVPGVAAQATMVVSVSDGAASALDAFYFRVSQPQSITGSDIRFLKSGDTWRYWAAALPLDPRGDPVDFTDPGLDDRAWPSGPSQLGYGNDGEATDVPVTPYRITTYFRKKFSVPNLAAVSQLKMRMLRDDGAVVYLNGTRVWTTNIRGTIAANTLADTDISGTAEDTWQSLTVDTSSLVSGSNTIAVELHQRAMPAALSPGDLSFDFELAAVPATPNSPDVLIAPGETWAYWDQAAYPDESWRFASFNEDGWKYGLARLGYGIGGESTVVNKDNASGTQRNPSVLFRKAFDVADPSAYAALHLFTQRDDGIAVHLNGVRVHLENLSSTATLADLATAEAPSGDQIQWHHYLLDPKRLIAGRNLVAVEIHQNSLSGTDLNFDLQLTGDLSGIPTLFIHPAGASMQLSWPAAYNEWSPFTSTDMTNWTPVAAAPLLDAGWIYVTHPNPGPRRFFRLEKP